MRNGEQIRKELRKRFTEAEKMADEIGVNIATVIRIAGGADCMLSTAERINTYLDNHSAWLEGE